MDKHTIDSVNLIFNSIYREIIVSYDQGRVKANEAMYALSRLEDVKRTINAIPLTKYHDSVGNSEVR